MIIFVSFPGFKHQILGESSLAHHSLFLDSDIFYQDACQPCTVCTVNICKDLVADTDHLILIELHLFNGFKIAGRIRLVCVADIIRIDVSYKPLNSAFLIVAKKQSLEACIVDVHKQLIHSLCRIVAMVYKSIIDIEDYASEALIIQFVIVYLKNAFRIFVGIKLAKHLFTCCYLFI